jgi:hypothetical protein
LVVLVINTPSGKSPREDEVQIRTAAVLDFIEESGDKRGVEILERIKILG